VPARGDSQQTISATLARLEAKIDRLAEQLADAEAEAEEIMRRAVSPAPARHTAAKRPRRATTAAERWLRAVRVALVAILGVAAVVALMQPHRLQREQYGPRCSVACSRPVSNADVDHDGDAH
jgi:hypothetical protein